MSTDNNLNPELVAAFIEQQCTNNPPNHTGEPPQQLFEDFDFGNEVDASVADLWHWGVLEVSECDDDDWQVELTAFGDELFDRGWNEQYINAKLGIVRGESTDSHPAVNDFTTQ